LISSLFFREILLRSGLAICAIGRCTELSIRYQTANRLQNRRFRRKTTSIMLAWRLLSPLHWISGSCPAWPSSQKPAGVSSINSF
jgi:hypothetical protein